MRSAVALGFLWVAAHLAVAPAHAEWVRGEVQLNVRTGPGPDRKIIASIATGDRATVLEHGDGWTLVRIEDGQEGWIPAGFLNDQPPAAVRLERTETELKALQERLENTSKESNELRTNTGSLTAENRRLSVENERLDTENRDLKAGARWPEWIAGASILVMGMLMGAIMQTWTARRTQGRVRLD
jgi:SH3 domain protein